MNRLPAMRVAPLVFLSGACALVYQIAWSRDFRLIFGASTSASAAVVAIFIGGLGFGGLVLGKRVERHPRPLAFYAALEALVAIAAALTPLLLWIARKAYTFSGGTLSLGLLGGSAARLVLAALVIVVPTFLMGGTLPAVACAVESAEDPQRRGVALLYGVNTLGAVAGCVIANFVGLEILGTRVTLWLSCLVNLLIAAFAVTLARTFPVATRELSHTPIDEAPAAPRSLVLGAAAVVGFAFFLMELVWYRMLGPLLGGTIFTFGLILAIALLGIGVGGTLYSVLLRNRPARLGAFGYTCLLEALCIAIPYALGDRLAVLALLLRPLGAFGFGGHILGWTAVGAVVIFPAAVISGVQFPLLIALLGRGRHEVGKQIGLAYAFNTVGAVLGALAGGFGLLPLLTAPGCWRLVAVLLALFGGAVMLVPRASRSLSAMGPLAGIVLLVLVLVSSEGPTAAWRHSSIGAGRIPVAQVASPAAIQRFLRDSRRRTVWEAEGVESSVALNTKLGLAFVVNGKADGNARVDAATQVMGALIGAVLHPRPQTAMVIGLGTGSTAGWLGAIDTVERVDVAELEPAIVEVARRCAPVNERALTNPKVHLLRGDAREILGVSRAKYDLVFSEPSNPYRAGVASLYTEEFYRTISERLSEGGIFSQWVQVYEIDAQTIRTIFSTLASVFPTVEVWQTQTNDLILVAARSPIVKDVAALRARVQQEPFARAMRVAWQADDLEGFFAHYLARPAFVRAVLESHRTFNTDDQARVEFGFAKSMGRENNFDAQTIFAAARARRESLPEVQGGPVDWEHMRYQRASIATADGAAPVIQQNLSEDYRQRLTVQTLYLARDYQGALAAWNTQPREPRTPLEKSILADAAAHLGHPEARRYVELVRAFQPTEAEGVLARILVKEGKLEEAMVALEASLGHYRSDPWPNVGVMAQAVGAADGMARAEPRLRGRLLAVLDGPFSVNLLEELRLNTRLAVAQQGALGPECVAFLAPLEPWTPWFSNLLTYRRDCYALTHHPAAALADAELTELLASELLPFAAGLSAPPREP